MHENSAVRSELPPLDISLRQFVELVVRVAHVQCVAPKHSPDRTGPDRTGPDRTVALLFVARAAAIYSRPIRDGHAAATHTVCATAAHSSAAFHRLRRVLT